MNPKLINKNRRDNMHNNNSSNTYMAMEDKKKKPLIERKGDWLCSKCRNLNFAFRLICNRCQLPKGDAGNFQMSNNMSNMNMNSINMNMNMNMNNMNMNQMNQQYNYM